MIRSVRRETYRADLRQAFLEWLKHNNASGDSATIELLKGILLKQIEDETDSKIIDEIEKVIDELESTKNTNLPEVKKLLRGKFGLTDQEVASMEKQSELFTQFMDEEGYKHAYDNPKYIIKSPKKYYKNGELDFNKMSKNATRDERNNMLIDTIWGVLTSPSGSVLSMLPGSYKNVKHSSRQQRILHDIKALQKFLVDENIQKKLQKITGDSNYKVTTENLWKSLNLLSVDDLDDFYEKNATIQSPMDVLDYVDNHRNLMDGNDLIGRFAVNSSNHYKFQFLNLNIKPEYRFKVNGVEISSIDAVKSIITGMRIGRMCAEFQAASPDNGKDPCLGDLNANTKTVSRISFLLRIGLDAQTIGVINTSDDLALFGKKLGRTSSLKLKNNKVKNFDLDIAKITKYFADYSLLGEEKFMEKYDVDDFQYLKDYSEWMKNIEELSGELSTASSVSRCDSPNGALSISIAETTQQRLKAEDFVKLAKSSLSKIEGLDKLIDIDLDATNMSKDELRDKILESKIPRLQAFYTLGLKSAMSLSKKWLVQMDDNVFNLVKMLRDETKNLLTKKRYIPTLKQFYSELIMYALSTDSLFSTDTDGKTLMEKRNYYLHDFPMKLKLYLEEKDDNGEYKHKEVRKLNIIKRLKNKSGKGITFENVNKVTPQARKHYTEELESMLNMGAEEAQLAVDLFMYSYYDSGLSFRYNSFGIFFTTAFMRAMPRYVDKLQKANNLLKSNSQYAVNFVYQFMINHPDIIFNIQSNDYTIVDKNTIRILKNQDGFYPNSIMSGIDSLGGHLKLIKVGTDIYVLDEGDTQTSLTYTKMPKIPTNTLYYDASKSFEEIEYDKLQKRGSLTSIPEKTKKKKDDMKEIKEKDVKEETKEKNITSKDVANEQNVLASEVPTDLNISATDVPLDLDVSDFDVPQDKASNDAEIIAQADDMDGEEYKKEMFEEALKEDAGTIDRALKAINAAPSNSETPNGTNIKDMNNGPTKWCKK